MSVQFSPSQSRQFSQLQIRSIRSIAGSITEHLTSDLTTDCFSEKGWKEGRSPHKKQVSKKQAGIGSAPGTFGELLQGALSGETNNFLVTFPINRATTVAFIPYSNRCDIATIPAGKSKSVQLIRRLLNSQGIKTGGLLIFSEQLPAGKGLASSSADMVASARAVADCYSFSLDNAFLSMLLRDIEPTDGVMYSECVAFLHRRCELIKRLGPLPSLVVVGIDEGNAIDTVEFNQTVDSHSEIEMDEYARLLRMISVAVRKKDTSVIGKVSTRSAEINQKYNPKQYLNLAIAVSEAIDALGVVVAHSGTYVGVLLDPSQAAFNRQFDQAKIALSQSSRPVEVFRSV